MRITSVHQFFTQTTRKKHVFYSELQKHSFKLKRTTKTCILLQRTTKNMHFTQNNNKHIHSNSKHVFYSKQRQKYSFKDNNNNKINSGESAPQPPDGSTYHPPPERVDQFLELEVTNFS